MYKLIVIDMDGTLLHPDHTISVRNKEAIRRARELGVRVVIATGRPLDGVRRYFEQLDMVSDDDYVICFNGALVQSIASENVVGRTVLHGSDLLYLYELSQELGVNIHAFSLKGCICPKMSRYTEVECEINDIPAHVVDFAEIDPDEDIVKVMMIDDASILQPAVERLPADVYNRFSVLRSAPYFLEFLDSNANKGTGLHKLATHLGIDPSEIIAIGDAGNDLHMVEYAGMGVAMANAFPELIEIAQFVTKSNVEDGVAFAIEQLVLNA